MEILLASHSPRRRELLQALQVPFEVVQVECEEVVPQGIVAAEVPQYLSKQKAQAYLQSHSLQAEQILLTADTIVLFENQVLGKPTDEQHARWMLQHLSNNTHQVITGVTLAYDATEGLYHKSENHYPENLHNDHANSAENTQNFTQNLHNQPEKSIQILSFSCTTNVHFIALTPAQIDYYIRTFQPMDKAGAYGIQEWIGHIGIDRIEGDYLNVMGLPLSELYQHLLQIPIFADYEQAKTIANYIKTP